MKNFLIIMFSVVLFCATIIFLEVKYQTNDNFEYFSPIQILFVFASFNLLLSTLALVLDRMYSEYRDSPIGVFFQRKSDIDHIFLFIPFCNIVVITIISYHLIISQNEKYQHKIDNYSSESPSETDV